MPRFELKVGDLIQTVDDYVFGENTLLLSKDRRYEVVEFDNLGDPGVKSELNDEIVYPTNARIEADRDIARAWRGDEELILAPDFDEQLEQIADDMDRHTDQSEVRVVAEFMRELAHDPDITPEFTLTSFNELTQVASDAANRVQPGSMTTVSDLIRQFDGQGGLTHPSDIAKDLEWFLNGGYTDDPKLRATLAVARALFCRLDAETYVPNIPKHV